MNEDLVRLDFAKKSYDEVLDATKHQDDKIGRFLTAIAFLFTGAIAFGARSEILGVRVHIGDDDVALPAIFLGLFLVFSILAVLLLLIALGPNLNLPSPERVSSEYEGKPRSRIYFLSMDRMTADAWWKQYWEDRPPTVEDALKNYVYDAHNLATKTAFKSGRTNEARATFTLALLFLALSVVLFFEAATRSEVADAGSSAQAISSYVVPWDGVSRGLVALVTSAFAFALAYDGLRYAQTADNLVRAPNLITPWNVALFAVPCLSALCLVPPARPWTTYAFLSSLVLLGVLVSSLLGSLSTSDPNGGSVGRRVGEAIYLIGGIILGELLALTFIHGRPGELLILSILWVAVLELPRLTLGLRSWFARTRAMKRYSYLKLRFASDRLPQTTKHETDEPGFGSAEVSP